MNRREFVLRELSPLLEATLSRKDEDETIRRLPLEDAQILVDMIDEVRTGFSYHYELRNRINICRFVNQTLDTPDLHSFAQKRYLRLLYRTCGHHAIVPNALSRLWLTASEQALRSTGADMRTSGRADAPVLTSP